MGKFSGILICSDFDGTLALKGHTVKRNIDAIRYFCDNGGLFSVVSGRTFDFLRSRSDELYCNTLVGCVNGTVIYDYKSGELISEHYMGGDIPKAVSELRRALPAAKNFHIFHKNGECIIHASTDDFDRQLEEAVSSPVLKLLIHAERPFTDAELENVKIILGNEYEHSRSWTVGLEIQSKGINKGYAVRKIAEHSGAKRVICAGDYENDIPLLEAADVAYAVDNAFSALKSVADRITVDVADGAMAEIISDLENEI